MPSGGLIVIVPIREGREKVLSDTLNTLGNDISGTRMGAGPRIEFGQCRALHFARMAVFPDPDRGPDRRRLLLTTDFDGDVEEHVRELITATKQPEAIWGCCEGYTGPDGFAEFIRRHVIEPDTFYIAFRGSTVGRIRGALALTEALAAFEAAQGNEALRAEMGDRMRWVRRAWLPLEWAWKGVRYSIGFIGAVAGGLLLILRLDWPTGNQAGREIASSLNRLTLFRIINFLINNPEHEAGIHFTAATPDGDRGLRRDGHPPEDAILQNQLTLVTDVRPGELTRQRAVLGLINLNPWVAVPGSLVGISTIHTVRWTLIDGGKRLLMASNYDGSWENYIDEFAELIPTGLDALWRSSEKYPADRSTDVAALKQFLRTHQVAMNVFYSAYKSETVLNVKESLEVSRRFGWFLRPALTPSPHPVPAPSQPAQAAVPS